MRIADSVAGGVPSREVPGRAASPGVARSRVRTWPIYLLAAPAMVAIWSGWVSLGTMTGFGTVNLLPGIVRDGSWATLNTAITLPVGMDAYAAYAIRVWLAGGVPARARKFAKRSAILALVAGYFGQVAYHLLAARGYRIAPWEITVLVSGVPVVVFGLGAALIHLLRDTSPVAEQKPEQKPEQEEEKPEQPEQEDDDRNDQEEQEDVSDIRKHRPAAETARLARELKAELPVLTQAQIAERLGISDGRLRKVLRDHPAA